MANITSPFSINLDRSRESDLLKVKMRQQQALPRQVKKLSDIKKSPAVSASPYPDAIPVQDKIGIDEHDDCESSMEYDVHEGMSDEEFAAYRASRTEETNERKPSRASSYAKMSRSEMRRAFIMSEILGKPKSRR